MEMSNISTLRRLRCGNVKLMHQKLPPESINWGGANAALLPLAPTYPNPNPLAIPNFSHTPLIHKNLPNKRISFVNTLRCTACACARFRPAAAVHVVSYLHTRRTACIQSPHSISVKFSCYQWVAVVLYKHFPTRQRSRGRKIESGVLYM